MLHRNFDLQDRLDTLTQEMLEMQTAQNVFLIATFDRISGLVDQIRCALQELRESVIIPQRGGNRLPPSSSAICAPPPAGLASVARVHWRKENGRTRTER